MRGFVKLTKQKKKRINKQTNEKTNAFVVSVNKKSGARPVMNKRPVVYHSNGRPTTHRMRCASPSQIRSEDSFSFTPHWLDYTMRPPQTNRPHIHHRHRPHCWWYADWVVGNVRYVD